MIRVAQRTALAALLLACAPAARAQGDECAPVPIVTAIAHGSGVRVVQLGAEVADGRARHSDPPGTFLGHRRMATYDVVGRAAQVLRGVLARRDRYACDGRPGRLDFGGDREGSLGLEFDTPNGPVRVRLELPGGSGSMGFASGVRFDFRLSAAAHRDWWRFLATFASERRSRPEDFLAEMLEAQGAGAAEPGAPGREPRSAAAGPPALDSLLCPEEERARVMERLRAECPEPAGKAEAFDADTPVSPEAVTRLAPEYPEEARRAGVQGTVVVHALVGCDGRVWCVRIASGIPELDEAALTAVRQWVFTPQIRRGRTVAAWITAPVKFSLH